MQMSSDATAATANCGPIWIPKVEKRLKRAEKRQKERKTMEDKLIIVVSGFPELHDTSLFVYRDNKKTKMLG